MANVRVLSRETDSHELPDRHDRSQLMRLAIVFDEVTHRIAALRARLCLPTMADDERTRTRSELAALEDDWRCLASARALAFDRAHIG